MQIEIYRGLGDRPGDEISDPLLVHENAIQARGTYAIDAATTSIEVVGQTYFAGIPLPGILIDLVDHRGRTRKGMLDAVEITLTRSDLTTFAADTSLTIEREL